MTDEEFEIGKKHTHRTTRPTKPFRELWFIVGRRGGKSFMAALIAVYLAVFVKWSLGLEKGYVMVIANDRRQAGVVFTYIKRILELPAFKGMVVKELAEELELKNGIIIAIQTSSYRSVRGFQIVALVVDETGTMRSEFTSNPVGELLVAVGPSLGNEANSMLISISTGFAQIGPQWERYRDKFGVDDPEILVWAASTADMNPTYSQAVIEKALKEDYSAASVEYGVDGNFFRADLESYLSTEALEGASRPGRLELAPQRQVSYIAGIDPSGGRGDAMVLSIAHLDGERAIQDAVRAWFPPFNPQDAVREFAKTLGEYGLREVIGDRYSGSWCSAEFEKFGITYKNAELTRSDYYLEFLPIVMRGGCELLDHKRQATEFRQLLRRTGKGKDSVDHPPNGSDDHSNACAISIVEAAKSAGGGAIFGVLPNVWPEGSGFYRGDDDMDEMGQNLLRAALNRGRK
jgi:hypothetical protein